MARAPKKTTSDHGTSAPEGPRRPATAQQQILPQLLRDLGQARNSVTAIMPPEMHSVLPGPHLVAG
jgi:hypothetical protein